MATSMIGPGALSDSGNAQAGFQQARQLQMLQQVRSATADNDDARIEKGAKQFEAMLLGSWLQQAEQSFATIPGAEDDENAAGRDQMMSLVVQSLAESLAASGGIGIAKMIAKAMHAAAEKAEVPAKTASQPVPQGPAEQVSGKI
jgi:Rod binding domain-containing protein